MLSLMLLVGGFAVAQVESPADEALTAQVRALTKDLNAAELTKRDAAEKGLIQLGPAAIALLPAESDRMPAEMTERLARVRQTLQQAQAEAAAQASLITLKASGMPLSEVIAELSKQSGNKISDQRDRFGGEATNPKLDLSFDKTPFWQALDEVLDQAEVGVNEFPGERMIALANRPDGQVKRKERASYSGPFRLQPVRFEAVRDLQMTTGQSLKLFMEVSWEPRLQPIAIAQPLSDVQIVGDRQDTITVDAADGEPEAAVNEESNTVELQMPLALPSRQTAKIASMKGKLKVLVPGQIETFRFDKLPLMKDGQPKKVEQRKAGVTVTVDYVRKNNSLWELQMRLLFDKPGQALESHRDNWIGSNEAFLTGGDKKRIEPAAKEQTSQDGGVGMKYLFSLKKGPEGMAFVYRTPVVLLEMPIEYELKDLDLP